MKKIFIAVFACIAVSSFALEMKGVGDSITDVTLKEFTKKLKNVQNEKGPIVFKSGSADIDVEKSKNTLKSIHEIIMKYPGLLVRIEGHTDNVGAVMFNLSLSQKRADAVMLYLIKTHTTPTNRLKAKGFGDTVPIADNTTEAGRAKNRRVDFSVFKMK